MRRDAIPLRGMRSGFALAATAAALLSPAVQAADGTESGSGSGPSVSGKRAWTIQPRLSVTETFTDNVSLVAAGRRSDRVTEVSPGVRIDANSARIKAHVDYQITEVAYANGAGQNRTQNSLNAFGAIEAIDRRAFVEFSGNIAQQRISAFGNNNSSNISVNANSTETSTFRVSPYLKGKLGGYANYELRYNLASSRSGAQLGSDTATEEWIAQLSGDTPMAALGWDINTSSQEVQYGNQRKSVADVMQARLTYRYEQQYRFWLSAGTEANDYSTVTKTSHSTEGLGFEWTPGPRTQISASREKRFFGDSDSLSLSHRTPRTAWKYNQSRSVSVLPNQLTNVGLGSVYDLLYSQLASQVPDPTERADAVNAFLQSSGIPANSVVTGGFLTSRASVAKNSSLSFALLGIRNSVTFAATRSEQQALTAGVLGDDFDNSSTVRQRGLSVNWAYKLSPQSSFNAAASKQRSSGSGGTVASTTSRSMQMGFQTVLGAKTNMSLSLRRSESETGTGSADENAATGTVSLKF